VLIGGGVAVAYCGVHGDEDDVPDSRDKWPGSPKCVRVDACVSADIFAVQTAPLIGALEHF
jgi:hypothetical protein